jgi:hypothetical protein
MAEYYQNRPLFAAVDVNMENDGEINAAQNMSEFDKHRKTLLMDDAEEGWASELCRYLGTMEHYVKKETDLVEWWQVY